MGLPYGENFINLTSTFFYDTPVWRTDGRVIAYTHKATCHWRAIFQRYPSFLLVLFINFLHRIVSCF